MAQVTPGDTVTVDGVTYVAASDDGEVWHPQGDPGTEHALFELPDERQKLKEAKRNLSKYAKLHEEERKQGRKFTEDEILEWVDRKGVEDTEENNQRQVRETEEEIAILEGIKRETGAGRVSRAWFGDRA